MTRAGGSAVRTVQVLFEYGGERRPFGSAYIRLLRPLTHPSLQGRLRVLPGIDFVDEKVDAVIVDRLWRPDVSLEFARRLVDGVRRSGAKLIYALDDNFLAIPADHVDRPSQEKLDVVAYFLRQAEAVLVTTPQLQGSFTPYNPNVFVLPHALDERLLVPRALSADTVLARQGPAPSQPGCKVIGCMGTLTHDKDLMPVLPALRALWEKHPGEFEIEFIGVFGVPGARQLLSQQELVGIPVRFIGPESDGREYPLFMLWYTSRVRWDIAIAPLNDSLFNRNKSDIKFLDYSAIAAAGIYSALPCYQSSVRHKETGWLVEHRPEAWVDALETLLSDDALRNRIACNAYNYLYSERILAHRAERWHEAIDQILA